MAALGLLLLAAAGVFALVVALANSGGDSMVTAEFFGYSADLSAGRLLLVGVVVGVAGMLGLMMLLAGMKRGASKARSRRAEAREYRGQAETLQEERDRLARELEEERSARTRAEKAGTSAPVGPSAPVYPGERPAEERQGRLFRR
jgi:signal transduction histidine kinase